MSVQPAAPTRQRSASARRPNVVADQHDRLLAERIRFGEQAALAELYDRYAPIALAVALRTVGELAPAEDVVLDVFLSAWTNIDLFDVEQETVRDWLLSNVRARAMDTFRSTHPLIPTGRGAGSADATPSSVATSPVTRPRKGSPRVIWMVDDDPSFRELSETVATAMGVAVITMDVQDVGARRLSHDLPAGLMLDGAALVGESAEGLLAGVSRIVICTARGHRQIAASWIQHPHVRVLLKPMQLDDFEGAIRWLAGGDDGTSWPTADPSSALE